MTMTEARSVLNEIRRHPGGVVGLMRDDQIALGRTIVPVGSVRPFSVPTWDWIDTLISMDAEHAYIVLVNAKRRRKGAFSRLVASIKASGLVPVVCSPTGRMMPRILERWGWQRVPGSDDHWTEKAAQ